VRRSPVYVLVEVASPRPHHGSWCYG
jgi:hypothetical protein